MTLRWLRDNFVVKGAEKEGPSCLTVCQGLFRCEVLEVSMVRVDQGFVGIALQVVTEMLERPNNS